MSREVATLVTAKDHPICTRQTELVALQMETNSAGSGVSAATRTESVVLVQGIAIKVHAAMESAISIFQFWIQMPHCRIREILLMGRVEVLMALYAVWPGESVVVHRERVEQVLPSVVLDGKFVCLKLRVRTAS